MSKEANFLSIGGSQYFVLTSNNSSEVLSEMVRFGGMIKTEDILERIESDFGSKAPEALQLLHQAVEKADYLNSDRIIRCIVYLAQKDISKLKDSIRAANEDWRDVILWAESSPPWPNQTSRVIRNFNKPFNEAESIMKLD